MTVELRRSSRVSFALPISISGMDSYGEPFFEHAETIEVSGHGAVLVCQHALSPGSRFEIAAHLGIAPRQARVVRITSSQRQSGAWKIAAEFSPPGNFWKMDSPPKDWSSTNGSHGNGKVAVAPSPAPASTNLPKRALILDDDPGVAAMVEEALSNDGWSVTVLNDPMKLEQALATTAYGIVISDFQMPGRTGVDVLRYLQASDPALARRFILMTGAAGEFDRAGVTLVGIPVLYKPFSLVKLLETSTKLFRG
ncbi:MAG: response regulator [Acidobacteria bacterium]|nr:response regulator [Acidobacteriota bacterium]